MSFRKNDERLTCGGQVTGSSEARNDRVPSDRAWAWQ
jgi:hypothetical protein